MISFTYTNFDQTTEYFNVSSARAKVLSRSVAAAILQEQTAYKILSIKNARSQIIESKNIAHDIKSNFTDLIVIGMGGSALNPESLLNLCSSEEANEIRVHFLNNTDPIFFKKLISSVSIETCAVLAISNSGQTLETNSLVGAMISEFEKSNITNLGERFFFITKPLSGVLSDIGKKISATIIEHTPNISGRFSGLTNVTTFVSAIAGVDVDAYIDGAESVIEKFLENPEEHEATKAATLIFASQKPIMVNIGYLQQFSFYLEWYSQIIAESLGKNGGGITPIRGLGPNDQHSMMQLYLDGFQDKLYTLFYVQDLKGKTKICPLKELGNIGNQYLSDINTANFQATRDALISKNLLTRTILLKNLSAQSVGALTAYSMLEIIILGHMMDINPFNQPGVELIKTRLVQLIG